MATTTTRGAPRRKRALPLRILKWLVVSLLVLLLAGAAFATWQGEQRQPIPTNSILAGHELLTLDKDIEQAHLCLSYQGLPSLHDDRHAMSAFSTAFGGGVSSRLFQRVREDEGLVYNIYAAPTFYPDCGEFTIYAACSPAKVGKVLAIVEEETQRLRAEGFTRQEFEQTMAQLRTGFVLGMESPYQRMASMGMNMLLHSRVMEPAQTLALLRKVSLRKVNRVAQDILAGKPKLAIVGKGITKRMNKLGGPYGQA